MLKPGDLVGPYEIRGFLGMAHEANGDDQEARAACEKPVARWPKGTRSRTVRWATSRLETLTQ
jgi:hypothetical protein